MESHFSSDKLGELGQLALSLHLQFSQLCSGQKSLQQHCALGLVPYLH